MYEVHEALGFGGMASVHRAVHRMTGREVALKRLLPHHARDQNFIEHFVREAELAMTLNHPNIVRVFEHGRVEETYYLTMELIEGDSVLSLLESSSVPVGVTLWIVHEILEALDYAMTGIGTNGQPFRIVHRDISPSNVIITRDGDVKVIDFGVAKSLEGRFATYSGCAKGKVGYMSPEVLCGESIEARSDLYSLGVLTWELLTRRRMFSGTLVEQIRQREGHVVAAPSCFNADICGDLDDLLLVATSEAPESRWPTARAMSGMLGFIMRQYGPAASKAALVSWLRDPSAVQQKTNACKELKRLADKLTTIPFSAGAAAGPAGVPQHADNTWIDADFDAQLRHLKTARLGK